MPALINPVYDTGSFPNSAVVQIIAVWDMDENGEINLSTDRVEQGSGAMIGPNAVLTAAHCVFNLLDPSIDFGHADWVFVHPGRNGDFVRPFGEVEANKWWVPDQYTGNAEGSTPAWDYDIAVIELESNIGWRTGWFDYGYLSPTQLAQFQEFSPTQEIIDRLAPFLPPEGRQVLGKLAEPILGVGGETLGDALATMSLVGSGATLKVPQYPGDFGYNGKEQKISAAGEDFNPLLAYTDDMFLYADMTTIWTTHGSSGAPLLASGVTVNGERVDNLIIGVLANGTDTAPRPDIGDLAVDSYARIDFYFDWINDILDNELQAGEDRPVLVDADGWEGIGEDSLVVDYYEGETITVDARISNVGAATAHNVLIRWALSTDKEYDEDDPLLTEETISSLAPFTTRTVTSTVSLPNLIAGQEYYIVYYIDPLNDVHEHVTKLANYYYDHSYELPTLDYGYMRDLKINVTEGIGIGLTDPSAVGPPVDVDGYLPIGDGLQAILSGLGTSEDLRDLMTRLVPRFTVATALQPDGKLVVAGLEPAGNTDAFSVVRYLANGSLDMSFGTAGKVVTDISVTSYDRATGVGIQPDGKIIVVGTTINAAGKSASWVARYRTNGTLDPSFGGGDGIVNLTLAPGWETRASSVVIQSDGRIVIGGSFLPTDGNWNFLVMRLRGDGTTDPVYWHGLDFGRDDFASAITLDSANRIIIAGATIGPPSTRFAIARLQTDLSSDTSFSGDGKNSTALGDDDAYALGLVCDDQDNIIVVGEAEDGDRSVAAMARYRASDGGLDSPFANGGSLVGDFLGFNGDLQAVSAVVQPDGKIVIAGNFLFSGGHQRFMVARFKANGVNDTSFQGIGSSYYVIDNDGDDNAQAMVLQADGKVAIAGWSGDHSGANVHADFAVLRVDMDSRPTVSISGANGNAGDVIAFTITSTDPAQDDINAGFTYLIDWNGDGVDDETIPRTAGNAVKQITHVFSNTQVNSIRVTATDQDGLSSSFSRSIQINYRPTATPQSTSVVNDGISTVAITLSGDDANLNINQPLVFAIATQPSHGTLSNFNAATGTVKYTPTRGYLGTDSFTFTVTDDASAGGTALTSLPGAVTINVLNAPPVADAGADASGTEMGSPIILHGAFTDPSLGDTHTFRWHLVSGPSGDVIADGTQQDFTFIPKDSGTYTFEFTVTDNHNDSSTDTVVVTVADVAPTLSFFMPPQTFAGQNRQFHVYARDISPLDQAGYFNFQFDWNNDGTVDETYNGGEALTTWSHAFAALGTYTVKARAIDKDGGVGDWVSSQVAVVSVAELSNLKSGDEFLVNTHTPNAQVSPALAMNPAGSFVVVWQSDQQDGDNDGIYGQCFGAAGAPLGNEFKVNSTTASAQRDPAVAMDDQGNFVVVWTSYGQDAGGDWGIFGQRFNSSGQTVGNEFQVNTMAGNYQDQPAVAMDAAGNFIVVWSGYTDGSGRGIYAQRYSSAGATIGSEFPVNVETVVHQDEPAVASDAAGNITVAYHSGATGDGSLTSTLAHSYNPAGQSLGAGEYFFYALAEGTYNQRRPAVDRNELGQALFAYESQEQTGGPFDIYAYRWDEISHTRIGSRILVNSTTAGSQERPGLAASSWGNFVVVWEGPESQGNGLGVFARIVGADGAPKGAEFSINTSLAGDQSTPVTAMNAAGGYVVVWAGAGQQGSSEVYAQMFFRGNQVPTAIDIPIQHVSEDAVDLQLDFGSFFDDADDGDAGLTYSLVSNSNPALFASLTINLQNLSLDFAADHNGVADIVVRATDPHGATIDNRLVLIVDPVNDAPVAMADSQQTAEETARTIVLAGSDVDGDSLAFKFAVLEAHGKLYDGTDTSANGRVLQVGDTLQDPQHRVTYVPNGNYNGADSFTFEVNDGQTDSLASTVDILVAAVNDSPSAPPVSRDMNENTPFDLDLWTVTADVETAPASLIFQVANPLNGSVILQPDGHTARFTPLSGFVGAASFTYTVTDTGDGASPAVMSGPATVSLNARDVIAFNAPAFTSDLMPDVVVNAAGLPDATVVFLDIDLNNDGDFSDAAETACTTAALNGGTAAFSVSFALPEGTYRLRARVHDQAGMEASNAPVTMVVDATPNSVTVLAAADQSAIADGQGLRFMVTFGEAVNDFDAADLMVSGTAAAVIDHVVGSGATYQVFVKIPSGKIAGTVQVGIRAGAVQDLAGNQNSQASSQSVAWFGGTSGNNTLVVKQSGSNLSLKRDNAVAVLIPMSQVTRLFVFGQAGSDTLTGPDLAGAWEIGGTNRGQLSTTNGIAMTFQTVESLHGGSSADTFRFQPGASISGKIDGGTGANTLDYSLQTTAVTVNLLTGAAARTGGVSNVRNVYAGQAGDTLIGSNGPNILVGNGGNDTLTANAGNDILLGGAGNDVMNGGDGRDILIGGSGSDSVHGGLGQDFLYGGLIAGILYQESNSMVQLAALNSLMAEWGRNISYGDRIAHLRNGGGLNGATRLNSSTLTDDGIKDVLFGEQDADWFWSNPLDVLKDRIAGERLN